MTAWLRQHWLALALAFLPPLVIWYWLERKEARLRVVLVADIPVVSVQPGMSKGITILYEGDTVSSVRAIEISISNTGNKAIRREDYEIRLSMKLPGRIIAPPTVTVRRPAQLKPVLELDGNRVVVDPLLLNGGNSFTFRTLLADWTQPKIPVEIGGRVAEVNISYSDQAPAPPQKEDGLSGGWFVALYFGGIIVVTFIVLVVTRLRLPRRVRQVSERRRLLELTPTQREMTALVLSEVERSAESPKGQLREMINRLELHLRGIAARVLGSPLSHRSLQDVLSRLEKARTLSSDEKIALATFLGAANDLSLVYPKWPREKDFRMVTRFGAELLAKHREAPSVLDQ